LPESISAPAATGSSPLRCKRPDVEEALLQDAGIDVPWALIERFATLVRESGSEDEREAARYVAARLGEFGVPHQVYEPELFLSVPVSASLEAGGRQIRAKAPSFSASTGPEGVSGELVYLAGAHPAEIGTLFERVPTATDDVRGKIVVSEGFGSPAAVQYFEEQGALAQIYINPGQEIHWGICTSIWGAPDLDSAPRQPRTPVIAINRPDGDALIEELSSGTLEAAVHTELKEGWFPCPVVVADIQGNEQPDRFVLVHGHIDSWDVGIGDNAVGDGTLLELARVFHQHRDSLARSLKVAWWPGHSTGRYGGSTWFADTFGLELERDCIAQVDIDSPGCRWATEYYDVSWMSEAEDFCVDAIRDATGKEATGGRPHQAGDYSFNNIGISGFFMLLSTMPLELLEQKGYYAVGGCGGNIAWHTENDTLELADRDNLLRDLRVYVTALQRVLNNPVHPFDFRRLAGELRETLERYAAAADGIVDLAPALEALDLLERALESLYLEIPRLAEGEVSDRAVGRVNDCLLALARILVPINYTRTGRFRTEPALPIPPLPDLAPALELPASTGHERHVLRTHVRRGANRVASALTQAAHVVGEANRAVREETERR